MAAVSIGQLSLRQFVPAQIVAEKSQEFEIDFSLKKEEADLSETLRFRSN